MSNGPLDGVKVLEVATLYAGPLCGTVLADFGAEVIKIEHPRGDPLRGHGAQKGGQGLWWKVLSRNKACATLDLGSARGQSLFRDLVKDADVVIESFRPGVMERWGLGYDALAEINERLVMARVTGFGQHGPYSSRPGFGTLAEAMSGWAHMNGYPDGSPTLPPFGTADGVAGLAAAIGVLMGVREAERTGRGQEVDIAIIEPLMFLLGPHPTVYQQLGIVPGRSGNFSPNTAPRNVYRTKDDRWVAVASSTNSIAERLMRLVGREDLVSAPWFATGQGRAAHREEVDQPVAEWIAARDADDVVREFERVGAAVAHINTVADMVRDPQYVALNSFIEVDDPQLGNLLMQNVLFRMSRTEGRVKHPGRTLGEDNDAFYAAWLGMPESVIDELRAKAVI